MKSYPRTIVLAAGILGLAAACGNPSDVGEQSADDPVARAVVVGQEFSPSPAPDNGRITVNARSGTQLLLSGKESESNNAPILRYQWEPADSRTETLVPAHSLVIRNSSTVALDVPFVRQAEKLLFKLTVIDANSRTASAEVEVDVEPIPDPDRFLTFLAQPGQFFVYTKLKHEPSIPEIAKFRVEAEHWVTYTDRGGQVNTVKVGGQPTVEIDWPVSPSFGTTVCGPNQVSNPVLAYDIPSLNVNDIAKLVQSESGGRDRLLELRDIDAAEVEIKLTLTPLDGPAVELCPNDVSTTPPPTGNMSAAVVEAGSTSLGVQSSPASDGVSQEVVIQLEQLLNLSRMATPIVDSKDSAEVYYNTIDPNGSRQSLSAWLALNGFDLGAPDLGAGAHAVYTNNFDLGFGRDMYVKRGFCDGDIEAPGSCDVASVVFNYASLEGAAKKIAPIVAVAMEYSRPDCPTSETSCPEGQRFTKFYTYAPDLRGDFVRVLSVDLDGRGEKFLPQACVVCHGGLPAAVEDGVYGDNGDVNSGWLTWDLDSFLYSDTDPSFSAKQADEALRGQFTRTGQEEAFRRLNYYTWLTMYREDDSGVEEPERYQRARELVQGWYGDAEGLRTSGTAWREVIPADWEDARAGDVYTDVFAQHCRACHVLHVPGASGQLEIGSYEEFVGAAGLATILQSGEMPLARMTMDRFWVRSGGNGPSAGEILRGHLSASQPFEAPGTPRAEIGGLPESVQLGGTYRLAPSIAEFIDEPLTWNLSSNDPGARLLFKNTRSPVLTGIGPRVQADINVPNSYTVELVAGDGTTVANLASQRSDTVPQISQVGDEVGDIAFNAGTIEDIELTITAVGEGGLDGELVFSLENSEPSVATAQLVCAPNGANGCVQNVRVETSSDFTPESTTVTVTATDQDGDWGSMSFNVRIQPGLNVNPCTFTVVPREIGMPYTAVSLAIGAGCVDADDKSKALEFERVSGPTLPHRACVQGGSCIAGTVNVQASNGSADYTPPEGRITLFGTTPVGPPDEFVFRVRYQDESVEWQQATVTVNLVPEPASFESFSTLRTSLNGSCGACHGSGAPDFLGADERTGYCRIFNGADSLQPPDFGNRYVDLASAGITPSDPGYLSALYLKAAGRLDHQGAPGTPAGDDILRERILAWIRQGAYYTDVSSQECP